MEPKSIKNRFKIQSIFCLYLCSVLWTVLGGFWKRCGHHEPSKMSVSCRRGAIFRKQRFSEQMRSWIDFVLIFGGFGSHSGNHFGIKIVSENPSKNRSGSGSILASILPPLWLHFGSNFGSQDSMQNPLRAGGTRACWVTVRIAVCLLVLLFCCGVLCC